MKEKQLVGKNEKNWRRIIKRRKQAIDNKTIRELEDDQTKIQLAEVKPTNSCP